MIPADMLMWKEKFHRAPPLDKEQLMSTKRGRIHFLQGELSNSLPQPTWSALNTCIYEVCVPPTPLQIMTSSSLIIIAINTHIHTQYWIHLYTYKEN